MVTKKTIKKTAKKSAPKRTATKNISAATAASMVSFRVSKDPFPFMSLALTHQTVYWIVLLAFIGITQLWLLKLQIDIANLTELIVTR